MKKVFLVLLILSLVLFGCLRKPPVLENLSLVTVDGDLSDWGDKLVSDASDDSKWGSDNELLKVGLLFDGANIYVAGEYYLGGEGNQNVFLALIDIVGRTGASEVNYTGLNNSTRHYSFSTGDIDIIFEANQDGSEYKVWEVNNDGSLVEITDQVNVQVGTGSTVVEVQIPITESATQVKGVFAISGGTGGGKQWVGDFYPSQPDHDATNDGGMTEPANVGNFVVSDSEGNISEETNQTEPTSSETPASENQISQEAIVVDGDLSDLGTPVATNTYTGGGNGADLYRLYLTYDATYLYIGFDTQNTGSWDVAYGIGIDVGPGGYYTGSSDAWGRKVNFDAGYAIDHEIYFWWGWDSGLGSNNFCVWNGGGWDYHAISDIGGSFAYTGDTTNGLQTMEIAIPWTALGGKQSVAVVVWVAGGDGSSAVDGVPYDSTVEVLSNSDSEWTDEDTFTNLYLLQVN
ncbi:hypothetical protein [Thermotoga sp. KOL6]|uniref:hypothetical protein n=1 Tax=Thermotoga sp. KOL6 TaxID=126741 RepID=UPI000C78AF49|nr:hypothetical protein [Thermotoga sp. KOL6]PLV60446.1 hypothetical protein AS005_04010 [Thermotoga sp. KOL6]